jgi:hypothetical protein
VNKEEEAGHESVDRNPYSRIWLAGMRQNDVGLFVRSPGHLCVERHSSGRELPLSVRLVQTAKLRKPSRVLRLLHLPECEQGTLVLRFAMPRPRSKGVDRAPWGDEGIPLSICLCCPLAVPENCVGSPFATHSYAWRFCPF